MVNDAILANSPVHTAVKDTQQAIAEGATALFGEKYGDRVRVVAIGDGRFSTELCGGTHVAATGDIGLLVLTEESGVAAGVRRVEALTGAGALAYLRDALDALHRAAAAANAPPADLATRIEAQAAALTKAQREIRDLKTRLAMGGGAAADADRAATPRRWATSPWSSAGSTGSIARRCGRWPTPPSRRSPTAWSFWPATPARAG